MAKDRIDKHIESKLGHHSTPMDVDAFWKDLEPKIEKKKKDRRGLIWFFFIPLFLGLVALVYLNTNTTPQESNDIVVDRVSTEFKEINESENKVTDLSNQDQNESRVETKESTLIEGKRQDLSNDLNPSNNNISKAKIAAANKDNVEQNNSLAEVNSRNSQTDSNFKNHLKENNVSQITEKQNESNDSNDFIFSKGSTSNLIINESKELAEYLSTDSKTTEQLQRTTFEIIHLDKEVSELKWNRNLLVQTNIFEEIELDQIKIPSWNSGFSAFGSYGQFDRSFNNPTDSFGMNLSQLRNSKERLLESVGGGFVYELKHRSGLYATLGLNYSRLNERYRGTIMYDEIERRDSIETGVRITVDTTVAYFSQADVLVRYGVEQIRYNSTQFIDLPISLGYRLGAGDFDFSVELGSQINLLTFYKGTIADESDAGFDLTKDVQSYFKRSTGLAWNGDLILGYNVNNKYRLWTGVSYLNRMSSVTNSNYGLDQIYKQRRLKLGIQMKL